MFRDNLEQEQYESWFAPITMLVYENSTLHVSVPSHFYKEQLELKYLDLIRKVLRHVYGDGIKLIYHFEVVKDQKDTDVAVPSTNEKSLPQNAKAANPFVAKVDDDLDSQLNPKYNFDNFCAGECNRLADAVGRAIVKNPSQQTYNPLFVFGPPGVGKTHLAQAIGLGLKEVCPRSRVLYITARLFEAQYTAASYHKRINEFIAFYQNIDTLIIDDIQDFIGKPGTQSTFFHIFNHLHLNGKQLILTSDVRPSEMDNMEERLLSRFKWGMTCELFRPDFDTRLRVLRRQAEQEGVALPEEVILFIAENVTKSFRELEGIMVSLLTHAMVKNCPITLELAHEVIANSVKIRRNTINFEMIAEQVSSYYNIAPDELFTRSRKREINDARQMVMYMTKKHTSLALTAIGTRLNRSHATVLHAVNAIANRLAIEAQLRTDLAAIEAALK